jgi:hypothetical protein
MAVRCIMPAIEIESREKWFLGAGLIKLSPYSRLVGGSDELKTNGPSRSKHPSYAQSSWFLFVNVRITMNWLVYV